MMSEANPNLARRRSSVTAIRSEYSDATRRTNSQEENRLVLTVRKIDHAKEATCSDIEQKKKELQKSLYTGRRQSCPALRLREYQDRLHQEHAQWNRKYQDFLTNTDAFMGDTSAGTTSAAHSRTSSAEDAAGRTDTASTSAGNSAPTTPGDDYSGQVAPNEHTSPRRSSKADIWSVLSTPKHPSLHIRASTLQAKFSDNPVLGYPQARRRSQGALTLPKKLEVPKIVQSHSADNLSSVSGERAREGEVMDAKVRSGGDVFSPPRSPRIPISSRLKTVPRIDLSFHVGPTGPPRSSTFTPRT